MAAKTSRTTPPRLDSFVPCRQHASMSRARSLLTALFCVFCSVASGAQKPGKEVRLLFTGDILPSRQVRPELERRQGSPWKEFGNHVREADWVAVDLERCRG